MFVQRCQPLPAPMARSHHCCSPGAAAAPQPMSCAALRPATTARAVLCVRNDIAPLLLPAAAAAPNAPLPSSPCLSSAKQNGWNQSEFREGGGARGSGPIRTAERNGGGGDCWRWARICDSSTAAGGSSRTKPTRTEPPPPPPLPALGWKQKSWGETNHIAKETQRGVPAGGA